LALPELVRRHAEEDLEKYCAKRLPSRLYREVRLEYEVRGNSVTLVERRAPWNRAMEGQPWTRMPIAQFRYDVGSRRWTVYWPDRNTRWHVDDDVEPSPALGLLLAEVDRDPTGIYWG
jgi:hypothetical protein